MQIYALKEKNPITVDQAKKDLTYTCPECGGKLKLRGGKSKQLHFYHVTLAHCRQSKKTEEHLQTQLYLLNTLGPFAEMEWRSPIGRIADIAWHEEKLIFEVQCSPISLDEAKERCQDYESLGYQILWILHDKRFNQKNLSAAEEFLRARGAYFTNIDKEGKGHVYDQFDITKNAHRVFKGPQLLLHPASLSTQGKQPTYPLPRAAEERLHRWPIRLENDLLDLAVQEDVSSMLRLERYHSQKIARPRLPLLTLVKQTYKQLLLALLKKI